MAFKHILKIQQCIGLLWNYFKARFLSHALLILGVKHCSGSMLCNKGYLVASPTFTQ